MKFETAVMHILEFEGAYVFDSNDPGGETNFGISKRAYPNLDIKNLTREKAIEIYYQDYWQPLRLYLIPAKLRLSLFDCAVNQGVNQAIKFLQSAVGVVQDGVLGPITIEAANTFPVYNALQKIILARLNHYQKIPGWVRYSGGWTRRLLIVIFASLAADN